MAIPAIAPEERLEWCEEEPSLVPAALAPNVELVVGAVALAVGADEVVTNGLSPSSGHGWPGNNMKVESLASCFWVTREVVALGLMTPTI